VGAVSRREYRDRELSKVMADHAATLKKSVENFTANRAAMVDTYAYHPDDSAEAHTRRQRLQSEFAALPSNDLEAMPITGKDYEWQIERAASLRKRGMHNSADTAYQALKTQQMSWKGDPVIRTCEREITKLSMLADQSGDSFWVGTDPANIKPSDYASRLPGGGIQFETDDGDTVIL